uniref:Uncharacterized protein AlNc14C8G1100 n=1 Tax=Albugo laibachii Nc14 TaxID=890382 RepID=F0W227_9STRA|nr:conserved hypothetical protein [Albugo laibachii Nc14]|eukprot:CCA15106.1 conserved hypothetical protein [Albugo laibachii Nc14]
MTMPEVLERDGLVKNLFHNLWSKDDAGNGPHISIPHTILYASGKPLSWYFTSLKTGRVKRKHKAHMTDAHIERSFLKDKESPTDIVAYYIHILHHDDTNTFASHVDTPDSLHEDSSLKNPATIQYFDTLGLRDFFKRCEEGNNQSGVLQRFITPKSNHNSAIRAIWSPRICLVDRRTNRYKVNDSKYSVYERAVTFDGPDSFSRHDPMRGTLLIGEVQLACQEIAEHLIRVSCKQTSVSTLVLHFKLDTQERLWLQWCSSLRTMNNYAEDSQPNVCHRTMRGTASAPQLARARPADLTADPKVPAHLLQAGALRRMQPSQSLSSLRTNFKGPTLERGFGDLMTCPSCGNTVDSNRMSSTSYRTIVQHYQKFLIYARLHSTSDSSLSLQWPPEQQLIQAAGGVGFGILPLLIEKQKSSYLNPVDVATNVSVSTSNSTNSSVVLYLERDWAIPPVLQHLNPSWTIEDYERYRHDPICMQKLIAVCENCCLTYLDYATNALELNNSIHTNAPITLRPFQENVDSLHRLNHPICPKARKKLYPIAEQHLGLGRYSQRSLSKSCKAANKEAWKPIPAPSRKTQSQGPTCSSIERSLLGNSSRFENSSRIEISHRSLHSSEGAAVSSTRIHANTAGISTAEEDCLDLLEVLTEDLLSDNVSRCDVINEDDSYFGAMIDEDSAATHFRKKSEASMDKTKQSTSLKKIRRKKNR